MALVSLPHLGFKLAWRFTEVLPGEFERDRKEVIGVKFPILGPRPTHGKHTPPLEGKGLVGPYLYLVVDGAQTAKYVGIATESGLISPIERWIRPDKQGFTDHWAHGTNKRTGKATIAWVKDGLLTGLGPYSLYFSNHDHLTTAICTASAKQGGSSISLQQLSPKQFIIELEHSLIYALQPEWNTQKKKSLPPQSMAMAMRHWYWS